MHHIISLRSLTIDGRGAHSNKHSGQIKQCDDCDNLHDLRIPLTVDRERASRGRLFGA